MAGRVEALNPLEFQPQKGERPSSNIYFVRIASCTKGREMNEMACGAGRRAEHESADRGFGSRCV